MENEDDVMQAPKAIYEMYSTGMSEALEDIYQVENLASDIKGMQDKIDFYKGLKKKRIEEIDNAVTTINNKISFYREVIYKTMQKEKQKSVTFPGVCKIATRKPSVTWTIDDEEAFIKFLDEKGEKNNVVEEIKEFKIIKKEANKLLNIYEQSGDVPAFVTKNDGEESISITFINEEKVDSAVIDTDPIPVKDLQTMKL